MSILTQVRHGAGARRIAVAAVLLAAVGVGGLARAETATIVASRDNTLYEDASGALSNGRGEYLFIGRTKAGEARRALLFFDVSAAIPPGATVDWVELHLVQSKTIAFPGELFVHRALRDWGEGTSDAAGEEGAGAMAASGDATWLHARYPDELWSDPGGDFASTARAVAGLDADGAYRIGPTASLTADVSGWLDDPDSNFGWVLRGEELAITTARRFNSSENGDTGTVPFLLVEYTPDPDQIFIDGFESGDTSAWSTAVP